MVAASSPSPSPTPSPCRVGRTFEPPTTTVVPIPPAGLRYRVPWVLWLATARAADEAVLLGTVLEHGSGLPLAGVAVHTGVADTTTDDRGAFRLALPAGEHLVTLAVADHRELQVTETLAAGETVEVRYRMERFSWEEELVVWGERREEVARTVLSIDELKRIPGSFGDPIRALQSLPSVSRGPELSGDIVARGAEALNTATYVDGVRIPFLFHFLVGRSVVDPGQIEEIAFYPGAVPPRYGDVTQAVVDAHTRFDAAEPGLHGQVHADLLEAGASVAAELGDGWTLRAGGRRAWVTSVITAGAWVAREVQGLNDPAVRPESLAIPYSDHQLRLVHRAGPDTLSFTTLGARDGIRLLPAWSDLDGDGRADRPPDLPLPYDPYEIYDNRFQRLTVRWDRQLPGHAASTWVTGGRDRQQNLVSGLGLIGASGVQFALLESGWFSVGHDGRHDLTEQTDLRLGGDLVIQPATYTPLLEVLLDPTAAAPASDVRVWAGPFVELGADVGRWRFMPGLRTSVHQLEGRVTVVPEPRLSLRWALTDAWSAVGYVGLLSQAPTLDRTAVGVGSGELSVFRAMQSTLGVEGRWSSGLGVDLAAYETELWGVPIRDTIRRVIADPSEPDDVHAHLEQLPYWRPVDGRTFGLEAMVRMRPRGPAFGWVAGTLGRSLRFDEDGTFRADADIPASLVAVGGAGLGRGWTISGRGQVASGLAFTPLSGVYVPSRDGYQALPGERNALRYPLYRRFDLRLDKTWTAKRARWTTYLDVYNVPNQRNPLFTTYDWSYRELRIDAFVPVLPTLGLEVAY